MCIIKNYHRMLVHVLPNLVNYSVCAQSNGPV